MSSQRPHFTVILQNCHVTNKNIRSYYNGETSQHPWLRSPQLKNYSNVPMVSICTISPFAISTFGRQVTYIIVEPQSAVCHKHGSWSKRHTFCDHLIAQEIHIGLHFKITTIMDSALCHLLDTLRCITLAKKTKSREVTRFY